jgi:Tfp pilus assembly protein PilF
MRASCLSLCLLFLAACGSAPVKSDKGVEKTAVATEQPKPKPPDISKEAMQAFGDAVASYRDQKKSGRFDYQELLNSFKAALDLDPHLAEAHYNMGCIYEAIHDDKQAIEHYKEALKIRSDLAPAAANWGALLARHGKLDQALLLYKRALSKEAKNSAVLLNMAAIYKQKKEFDKALTTAAGVLVRDPGNIGAYRLMASLYYDKGDLDMAHLVCLRGLKVGENDPRLLNTLGLVLLKLKKVPEALAQFRQALKGAPDMVGTRFNVAKIALDYKDFRIAKEEFSKILEYEPENRKAAIGLGIALRGAGDFKAARSHFEALADRYPKVALPHYWLGVLAMRNFNDMKTATKEFSSFVKLAGSRLPADHQVFAYMKEIKMSIQAEKKMKEMEKKAELAAKRQAEEEKKLADMRFSLLEKAWAEAEKNGGVLPPKKLNARDLPFILLPPAVIPDIKNKVKLFGMEFKGVKMIRIGKLKVKWKQMDKNTLVMIIPKWLGFAPKSNVYGPWDVMITYKDKHEDPIIFQGGLWVGKKPKPVPKPKEKPKEKPSEKDKGTKNVKEPGAPGGVEGKQPAAKGDKSKPEDVKKGSEKAGEKGAKDEPGADKAKPKEPKRQEKPGEPAEPAEPGEPGEPKEAG